MNTLLPAVSSSGMRGSSQIQQSQGFEEIRLVSRVCENDKITLTESRIVIFRGSLEL